MDIVKAAVAADLGRFQYLIRTGGWSLLGQADERYHRDPGCKYQGNLSHVMPPQVGSRQMEHTLPATLFKYRITPMYLWTCLPIFVVHLKFCRVAELNRHSLKPEHSEACRLLRRTCPEQRLFLPLP